MYCILFRFRELVSMLSEAHKEASVIRKEAQDAMAMIQVTDNPALDVTQKIW